MRAPFSLLPRLVLLAVLLAPLISCASAVTVGQTVIVLNEPEGYHARERMQLHEEIHKRQYREAGTFPMLLHYLLSPGRRLELEAEAYAAELCYVMRLGTRRPEAWREGFAAALRGYRGGSRGISQQEAEAHLARAFQEGARCGWLLTRAGRGWLLAANPSP